MRRMTRKRLAQPGTQTSAERLVCTCSVWSPSSQNSKWGFLHFKSSKCRRVWGQRRIIELPCCLHTLLACYNLQPRECTPGSGGEAGVSQLENSPSVTPHIHHSLSYYPLQSWKVAALAPVVKAMNRIPLHRSRHAAKSLGIYAVESFSAGNCSLWCLRISVRGFV